MAANLQVSAADFEKEVLQSDLPVVVDFWAEWCGPCKQIAPSVEQLAAEFEGRVKVRKFDVDSDQDIAVKHGIMSIPALIVFKGGKEVDRMVGAGPKDKIKAFIERHA